MLREPLLMLGVGDFSTPLAALASIEMTTGRSSPSVEMTKNAPPFRRQSALRKQPK